ncbi:F-box domain containing protein [Hordeum vulgare]|nr:F-box domain containing protein [Hordeum vulgare]
MASAVAPHGRPQPGQHTLLRPRSLRCFDDFFRDAMAALTAYHRRRGTTTLKRLTLFLTEGAYHPLNRWYSDPEPKEEVRVAGILADPAAAGLEGLRIAAKEQNQCDKMLLDASVRHPRCCSGSVAATIIHAFSHVRKPPQ